MNVRERFDRHVMLLDDSPDSCWIWTGALNQAGYGRFRAGGRGTTILLAHRVAWALLNGAEPPRGWVLRRTCNQPLCVRHWRLGGPKQKLTPEQRARLTRSQAGTISLARHYGVSRQWVWELRSRACGLTLRHYNQLDRTDSGGVLRLEP